MTLRTDINVVPLPTKLPNFGGLLGMNTVQVDPDFGTTIIRATDNSMNTSALQTADGAFRNIWNTDDSMLMVRNNGGGTQLLSFVAGKFTDLKLPHYGSSRFSSLHSNVFFEISKSKIIQFTLVEKSGKWTTTTKEVCDFAHILPNNSDGSPFKVKWAGTFGISADDSTFLVAYSQGVQQTGFHTCVYRVGLGYRMLDTQTGIISEVGTSWGEIGQAVLTSTNFKFPFFLHESNVCPNPTYGTVGPSAGVSDTILWELATLKLNEVTCTGHAAKGMKHIYPGGVGAGNLACYAFTDVTKAGRSLVLDPKTLPPGYTGDRHHGFGKLDANDNSILWGSSLNVNGISAAWENEVFGYDIAKKIVYRACHTFTTPKPKKPLPFKVQNSIACPSQTGKYVAWASDMMGTLGGRQGDVFVVTVA